MAYALTNGGTADKIELITVGANVSLDVHVTQIDKLVADTSPTSAKTVPTNSGIVTATTTKITTDPASTHEAIVKAISIVNTHASAACTVQPKLTLGAGTGRVLTAAINLNPGDKLEYSAEGVWFAYDSALGVKTAVATALTRTVLTAGAAATYTTPAGCRAIDVECIGGGGAGGGSSSVASSGGGGGGGGAGGYTRKLFSPPAATYTYTIGAAGAAGAVGANAGGAGGDTTFGSLTAKGGSGGSGATAAVATIAGGGAGGIAGSGGDINAPGEPGDNGVNTTAALVASGTGGSSDVGGGANGRTTQGTGTSGVANTGAGGSGGASVSAGAAVAGGAGGTGVIIATEYY